jgi:hypothetical protein
MPGHEAGHERRHVPPAEAGRGGDAQVAARLHAAGAHAGLGGRQVGQQALAVLEEGAALVGERDAAGGAHQQLHAQAFLQRIDATAHHRGGDALGGGRRGEAALGGHRDEGFDLLELVHGDGDYLLRSHESWTFRLLNLLAEIE